MYPTFVNKTISSKSVISEALLLTQYKHIFPTCFFLALLVGASTIFTVAQTRVASQLFPGALFFVLLVALPFLIHFASVRTSYNNSLRVHGEIPVSYYHFYDNYFVGVTNSKLTQATTTFFYQDFKQIKRTKNLYLLKSKPKGAFTPIWYIVERKGFEQGNPADFPAFFTHKIRTAG